MIDPPSPYRYSPSEKTLWENDSTAAVTKPDDRTINERYAQGEGRIVIETNREKLPGFVALMKQPEYMDLRPFYQRRPRWSAERQSLLIESFIMNIPVPPVFLYEKDFNTYEVMDGQQRITAIRDFYSGHIELTGLKIWPELNGRTYQTLPTNIKAGIDRRSITSIVLLKESTQNEEEAFALRETVFERLNTGGIKLERQEIRNALYPGPFNNLLAHLSKIDAFREAWGLPRYVENEASNHELFENPLFSKMGDLEIVLRFFALRHADHYRDGMQGFLDIYMRRASRFENIDINYLDSIFRDTLNLAVAIYGKNAFHPYNSKNKDWESKPHRAFYDAVMVGLLPFLDRKAELISKTDSILAATAKLFVSHPDGTFTGRKNSKSDVIQRIGLIREMLEGQLVG